MPEWVSRLKSFTGYARDANPAAITFIIGAGASFSSGAPTTAAVIEALLSYGQFPDLDVLRSEVHTLSDAMKKTAILKLFPQPLVPYLGYRPMAAIRHSKRVLVLNP